MTPGFVVLWLFAVTGGVTFTEIASQLSQSLVTGSQSRLELLDFHSKLPSGCVLASVKSSQPIAASGRYAVKVSGRNISGARCQGWAWARVKVLAKVKVTIKQIGRGEPISQNSVRTEERETKPGQEPAWKIPLEAKASTMLLPGTTVEMRHIRIGPAIGETIEVELRIGQVSIVQTGRVVPCVAGRLCAQLKSGKRMEGQYQNGRLVAEFP